MGIIGGHLGFKLLKSISQDGITTWMDGSAYREKSKLDVLLGPGFIPAIKGRTVIDFGCGTGAEAVEMAQRGAKKVIGIDIHKGNVTAAQGLAGREDVGDICTFAAGTAERADVIVSIDAFEHFNDPAAILGMMRKLLKPDGCVFAAFGPTWYHPLGGHTLSVFPWAHILFTERALLQWRNSFKQNQIRRLRFSDEGLNQMTIRRFEQLVEQSPFQFAELKLVPIRKLRRVANRFTREVTTAVVRCKLIPRT
jgi:SAM-dependent methyltransferase